MSETYEFGTCRVCGRKKVLKNGRCIICECEPDNEVNNLMKMFKMK